METVRLAQLTSASARHATAHPSAKHRHSFQMWLTYSALSGCISSLKDNVTARLSQKAKDVHRLQGVSNAYDTAAEAVRTAADRMNRVVTNVCETLAVNGAARSQQKSIAKIHRIHDPLADRIIVQVPAALVPSLLEGCTVVHKTASATRVAVDGSETVLAAAAEAEKRRQEAAQAVLTQVLW